MIDHATRLTTRQYREIRRPLEALDLRLQVLVRRLRKARRVEPRGLERELTTVRSAIATVSRRLDQTQEGTRGLPSS